MTAGHRELGDGAHSGSADILIDIVLVTSESCHLCEKAKDALAELSQDYPLQVRTVDIMDPLGSRLARETRAPFPPLLFVNGELHGHGRLSPRRLQRQLDDLMARL